MDNRHLEEELNERARWLRIRRKLWAIPVAAAACALLCVLIYTLAMTAFGPARTYRAESKLYLTFEEGQDEAQVYYNGATWTDLLTADPAISDVIVQNLPDGTDLDTVRAEATAEILTDIRLMTVTVQDADPARAEAILEAVDRALVHFGGESDIFASIELLSTRPAALVVYSYRTRNAAVLGLLLGAAGGFFWVLLAETLDDAAYVPEDMERRYGLPVAGVLLRDGTFYGTTKRNYDYLTQKWAESAAGGAGGPAEPDPAVAGAGFTEEKAPAARGEIQSGAVQGGLVRTAIGNTDFAALRSAAGVMVEIPFGVRMGTQVEAYLSDLRKQDVKTRGLLLTGADPRFLQAYYRAGLKKSQTGPQKPAGGEEPGRPDSGDNQRRTEGD